MEADMSVCVECSEEFQLTEGEKDFYIQRDLVLPKRCKSCRVHRKQNAQQEVIVNGTSNTNPSLFEIYCDNCGRDAKIPFPPEPNRKAYCRVCWNGVKNVGTEATFS